MKIDCNTSLKDLLQIAKGAMNELQESEEFIVKDLFRSFEWNRIDVGNRSRLGAMFFNFSKNDDKLIIVGIGKTAQNQQKYRKLHDDEDATTKNEIRPL
jgi:hypothetical protein